MHSFLSHLLMFVLLLTTLFLIVLVLIQRGRAAAWPGPSAAWAAKRFGTKAGDLFTKITIGVATFWIILCMIMVKVLGVGGGA